MIGLLIVLFIAHYVADFLLQTRKMGKNKSVQFKFLLGHIAIIFGMFFVPMFVYYLQCLPDDDLQTTIMVASICAFTFSALNALIHGVIDWFIWRFYKLNVRRRLDKDPWHELAAENSLEIENPWKYWEDSHFYATIGLDQLLHALTLFLLLGWLA